jgi:hypothetical protein
MKADRDRAKAIAKSARPPRNMYLWKPMDLVRYGYEMGYMRAKKEEQQNQNHEPTLPNPS